MQQREKDKTFQFYIPQSYQNTLLIVSSYYYSQSSMNFNLQIC